MGWPKLRTVVRMISVTALGIGFTACRGNEQEEGSVASVSIGRTVPVLDTSDDTALTEPFGRLRGGVALDDSTLAIADGTAGRVRVVRDHGRLVAEFGALGDGPGEFRRLSELATHDGILFAFDSHARRLTSFDATGSLLTTMRTFNHSSLAGRNYRVLATGHHAVRDLEFERDRAPEVVYRMMDPAGEPIEDIRVNTPSGWAGLPFILEFPFDPHIVSALGLRGEVVMARTDRYQVIIHRESVWDTIVGTRDPVPVHAQEAANFEEWAAYVTGGPDGGGLRAVRRWKPLLRDIWVGTDGTLVIELHNAGLRDPEPPTESQIGAPRIQWIEAPLYDLYSDSGRFVGRLELPLKSRIIDVRLPSIWLNRPDSVGRPRIERWVLAGG